MINRKGQNINTNLSIVFQPLGLLDIHRFETSSGAPIPTKQKAEPQRCLALRTRNGMVHCKSRLKAVLSHRKLGTLPTHLIYTAKLSGFDMVCSPSSCLMVFVMFLTWLVSSSTSLSDTRQRRSTTSTRKPSTLVSSNLHSVHASVWMSERVYESEWGECVFVCECVHVWVNTGWTCTQSVMIHKQTTAHSAITIVTGTPQCICKYSGCTWQSTA